MVYFCFFIEPVEYNNHVILVYGLPSLFIGQMPAIRQDIDVNDRIFFVDSAFIMADGWWLKSGFTHLEHASERTITETAKL